LIDEVGLSVEIFFMFCKTILGFCFSILTVLECCILGDEAYEIGLSNLIVPLIIFRCSKNKYDLSIDD